MWWKVYLYAHYTTEITCNKNVLHVYKYIQMFHFILNFNSTCLIIHKKCICIFVIIYPDIFDMHEFSPFDWNSVFSCPILQNKRFLYFFCFVFSYFPNSCVKYSNNANVASYCPKSTWAYFFSVVNQIPSNVWSAKKYINCILIIWREKSF